MKDQIKSRFASGPERGLGCKHNYFKMKSCQKIIYFNLFPAIAALTLTGCWTPPNANVQPGGEPRLIQDGISAESIRDRALVQTIDASQRILNLKLSDGTQIT